MQIPEQTVADVVLDHSECAQVFQRHRIDFCCRGDMSVEAAAKEKGIALGELVDELARAIEQRRGGRQGDPREMSTPLLVAHIVSKHHGYLRTTLPFVKGLAKKVSGVHGDHNPKLRGLREAVDELADALIPHLDDEEQVLFPALMAKDSAPAPLAKHLQAMNDDHQAVAKLLETIRAASDEFALPDWACNSYRTLFAQLQQLEEDLFTHVHLENHVLKPRFTTPSAGR